MAEPTRTGYSTAQFANFSDYENGSPQADGQDNPAFAYPGNRIPNIYDRAGEGTTNTLVQRGFIRGIFPEILNATIATNKLDKIKKSIYTAAAGPKDAVTRRCFFQFNPALILRSVEASTTVLIPLLQPATELLQPIPGQAAFEFQLLFNREREVSNHRVASGFSNKTGDPNMSEVGTFSNKLSNYGADGNPYNREHVADLGVLADLYVLDSIIGQSITQDSISALTSYWDLTQKNKTSTSSTVTNQDGTKTVTTTKPDGSVSIQSYKTDGTPGTLVETPATSVLTNFTDKDTKDKLSSVLGNSAFLSPLPVRIVFSSLFMVEGFVTSSNVAFHKFSSTMVPTVCSVTLNVQALYLGFAKKESYVSQQLATQVKATAAAVQADLDAQKTAKEALQGLSLLLNYVIPHGSLSSDSLNSWWAFGVNTDWYFNGRVSGKGARFDSKNHSNGLITYINTALLNNIKNNYVQNILIDKVELIVINKDALPDAYKNVEKLKEALNKGGQVPGKGPKAKIVELLRTEINIVDNVNNNYLDNGTGSNGKTTKDAIQTPDIEKSTAGKPIKKAWQSSPLQTGTEPNNHFGLTNIMIAVVVKISCNYASGNVDSSAERVSIYKSTVLDAQSPTLTGPDSFIAKSINSKIGFTIK